MQNQKSENCKFNKINLLEVITIKQNFKIKMV